MTPPTSADQVLNAQVEKRKEAAGAQIGNGGNCRLLVRRPGFIDRYAEDYAAATQFALEQSEASIVDAVTSATILRVRFGKVVEG